MLQIGRNAIDSEDGRLIHGNRIIVDRDTKYWAEFRALPKSFGIEIIRLPPRSPNLNAYAERFVGSIKHECLNRLIFVGEASLRRALREYIAHYHAERNHQGLGNELIAANDCKYVSDQPIIRRERFGGLLSYYCRASA